MLPALFEALTGRSWKTTRSCAGEFGPPPGAVYAEALRHYTDAELMGRDREAILAEVREQQAAVDRLLAHAHAQDWRQVEVGRR